MAKIETVVRRDQLDVERRLLGMDLSRALLMQVASVALSASADATPFHPANAAGTLAYQHGTWALRDAFVAKGWVVDRTDNVEAIKNEEKSIRVIFANVDCACNDIIKPRPRSRKGAGAERVCAQNDFFGLLGGEYTEAPKGRWATFYLMVAEDGAVELSQPIVKDGAFVSWVERIYISDGGWFGDVLLPLDTDDTSEEFDPKVARRR